MKKVKYTKILLINPDYYENIFQNSKVRSALERGLIPVGLASISGALIQKGCDVKILDLNLLGNSYENVSNTINIFKPEIVGITATTPIIYKLYKLAEHIKKIDSQIIVIAGGPHPSAMPEEILKESLVDCVVKGEGEFTMTSIIENGILESIPNIYFKDNGNIIESIKSSAHIKDLDILPFPAYHLFNIDQYKQPKIASRKEPMGYLETSRGCYGKCIFCNKNIHGFKYRVKSATKVVDEIEKMLEIGFKEIQIIDDVFSAKKKRVYEICEEINKRNLQFPWYPRGGLRVETVDYDLLYAMKESGCYRVPFGIETGSERILKVIKKGITLEMAEKAVNAAKKAKLETECYFMMGHPTETEEDIKKTIKFALKLDPDYVKFAITIPLPGTELFDIMMANRQIKTKNWEKFTFSTSPSEIYIHDVLSWKLIDKYMNYAYRKYYFRRAYIFRMLFNTIKNKTFFGHVKAFINTKWL